MALWRTCENSVLGSEKKGVNKTQMSSDVGRIYVIKNDINDKVYVGQTIHTLKMRFSQHLKKSMIDNNPYRKLYNAIRKYGKVHFFIELVEDNIPISQLNEKEIYYIEQYNSFEQGYNSTCGGDSKNIYKDEDVKRIKELISDKVPTKQIAELYGVCPQTIQRLVNSLGIKRRNLATKEYLLENINKTNYQMAEELGVDNYTITRAFKKYGIKRGKGYFWKKFVIVDI